jgi:hypothetical protein
LFWVLRTPSHPTAANDLFSSNDYASIWYKINSRYGNVGSFDPDKLTIVMLPSSTPRSWTANSMIHASALSLPSTCTDCGKSSTRHSVPRQLRGRTPRTSLLSFRLVSFFLLVEGGLTKKTLQLLHLPIIPHPRISTNCALRFAACTFSESHPAAHYS